MLEALSGHTRELLVVYVTYLVATASPGPSNMAIMATAMGCGRAPALALAAGVMTGSLVWATLAATGVSALLAAYAHALSVVKILGGAYLLYLAWRAARSACSLQQPGAPAAGPAGPALGGYYRQGLMLHLTNPKSILAWVAIMSLGVQAGAPLATTLAIIAGCAALGVLVFFGYALAFSTSSMSRLYRRARRGIEAVLAACFALAGIRLLTTRF